VNLPDTSAVPRTTRPTRVPAAAVTLATVVAVAVLSYLAGRALNAIPQSSRFGRFWLGNLAAPFVFLPFAAGTLGALRGLSTLRGAALGFLGLEAAFLGFYHGEQFAEQHRWSWFVTMPWLQIGAVFGPLCGWLGHRWVARAVRWPAVLCASVLVLEPANLALGLMQHVQHLPLLWSSPPSRYPWTAWNVSVWAVEFALGLVALAVVIRRSPPRRSGRMS
jgi:hypothetical protein